MEMKLFNVAETFNIETTNKTAAVPGYAERNDFVPRRIDFEFDLRLLTLMINWWMKPTYDGFYLWGPTQCGKSEFIDQFAARLNIPVYPVSMHKHLRYEDITATLIPNGESVEVVYGPLPLAMGALGRPGILVLNEMDRAPDAVLCGIHEVFRGRGISIDGRQHHMVNPMPGFKIAATGNTNLSGQGAAHYRGAKAHDVALINRFWKVKTDYLPAETEKRVLLKRFGNIGPEIEAIFDRCIRIANRVREISFAKCTNADSLPITISTNDLIRWMDLMLTFGNAAGRINPTLLALDTAVLSVADPVTRTTVHGIVRAELGLREDDIIALDKYLAGKI